MATDNQLVIIGNLVAEPELRYTNNGHAVANFRIANTPRSFNKTTDEWEDGESLFLTVNVWRQAAENVAATLTKGTRVTVTGRLKQRQYDKDGEKRTVYEVEADDVAVSLKNATAKVERTSKDAAAPAAASTNGWGSPATSTEPPF